MVANPRALPGNRRLDQHPSSSGCTSRRPDRSGSCGLAPTGIETEWFGYTWSWNILLPIIVLLVFLVLVATYPFIEKWVTGDEREHHVLDRPRNAPTRTAIGAAGTVFYAVLWAGAGTDLIATNFYLSLNQVLTTMQILLIVGPIIAFIVTKRVCLSLQRKDQAIVLHGRETGRVIRLPHGEYVEVHEPLDKFEMYKLVDFVDYKPTLARPNAEGKITVGARVRAAFSRFYFEDRVAPVTAGELAAAHAHGHHDEIEAPKAAKQAPAKKPAAKKTAAKPAAKKAAPKKK